MHKTSVYRVLLFVCFALLAPVTWAGDALSFFNNWFVTGDYVVAGVGLRGTAGAGTINMSGVPAGAEPIAAFLYWSTVETSASAPSARVGTFNGYQIQGAALGSSTTPNLACSSSGGTIDPNSNGRVYRADVLRYLPVDKNNVRQANGSFPVKLAASGAVLYNNGASLVVIYRIVKPGDPDEAPLRAVVIYNGAFTMNKNTAAMTQSVAGFYQASANSASKVTSIVANGQPGFSSPLSLNGTTVDPSPFVGAQKTRWDNPTYNFTLAANASSFSALATASSNQTCLTWAAIISSAIVTDTDRDGLLDIWETKGLHRNTKVSPATFGTCSDYPAEPCENLPAMGADPTKRDIFIQMDWMHGTSGVTHVHMPKLAALSQVASTFALHGIRLHFDVGISNNYQGNVCGSAPCGFIIPAAYAQGGSDISESTLLCQDNLPKHTCDYHQLYPVLSFEFGFASVRDGNKLLNISPHFAQDRLNVFHYALFAHALGGPFNVKGQPVDPITGLLTSTPLSYSGIAHRPGGGFMVTFGLWRSDIPANDQVGSVQAQAGTIMHELGHNLGLGHAGLSTKPNCLANYPSIMNYLYQIRGLTDAAGNAQVDFSSGLLFPISENFLSTSIPMSLQGIQRYKVRYYGPLAATQTASQAAQLHCDGTAIKPGEPFEVRLEGSAVATPDWSNGTVPLGRVSPPLDANYDGVTGQTFFDQPDWFALNLRQIGTGYSFGGLSVGAFATDGGAYATDGGAFATDAGALATDGGAFATDGGAFATDGGAFATDGGAFATDGGAFATDGGAYATDAGDIDQSTALLSSVDPPTAVSASNTTNSIVVSWLPPDSGQVNYNVYRCAGAGCVPAKPAFRNVTGGTATPSLTDTVNDYGHAGSACPPVATVTCANTTYVYSVTSLALVNAKLAESVFSKTVNSEVKVQFVVPDSKTATYDGTNQSVPFHVYGDFTVALDPLSVHCPSLSNPARNAGTYPILCTGPNTSSLTDGVVYLSVGGTYIDNAGLHTGGSLIISQRPITVTAAFNQRKYDGTTNASGIPTITTGTLGAGDSPNFSETYDNPNVGTTHFMTLAGTVTDGNGGNNYAVTPVRFNAGVIDPALLTITATNQSKTYGTTFSFAGTEFTTGTLYSTDTVTSVTLTSAGTPATATVAASPYPIVPSAAVGAGLTNYAIAYANGSLTVNQAPASVTPNANNKTYGNSDPPFTGALVGFVAADGVTATYARTAGENVTGSPYAISGTLSPASVLSNYSITYKTANFTINAAPASVTPDPKVINFGMGEPPLTGTLAGFLPADGVTATYARAPGAGAGIYSISATLTPTAVLTNYSIVYNTASFTINMVPQNITFGTLSNQPFNAPNFSVSAIASSGLTVTFSTASTNCSVTTAGMVHVIASGNCTITAQQPGDGNYFSAANVSQSFTIGDGFASVDFTTLTPNALLGPMVPVVPIATALDITMTNFTDQASSAWFGTKQTVGNGFTTQFQFQLSGATTAQVADGFAFVIQNSSLSALGSGGGGIGYDGIPNSLAIEFDTYLNGFDLDANHIAVQSNGTSANSSNHTTTPPLGRVSLPVSMTLANGKPHIGKITYDGTSTLVVFLDGTPVLSATGVNVNLNNLGLDTGGKAFIGFTSGTGAASETTVISDWSFSAY